jgi:uncharacterized protein YjbI with pentapeptide repeats
VEMTTERNSTEVSVLHNSISTDDFFVALDRHEAWVKRVQLLESLDNEGKLILFEHELGNFRISNRDLSSCELIRCRLRNMTFIECDFTAALLIGSVFENCTFNDCSFYKADIGDSIAIGADFSGSRLIKAELP